MDMRNVPPEKMEALLKAASAKLGVPPEKLKRELMQGKFDTALKNMKPDEAAKFSKAVADPRMVEKLMSTPQAQALYKKLTGSK